MQRPFWGTPYIPIYKVGYLLLPKLEVQSFSMLLGSPLLTQATATRGEAVTTDVPVIVLGGFYGGFCL